MANTDIVISAAQIAQWKSEKERLEREIADRQQKVGLLSKKLDAAATLAGAGGLHVETTVIRADDTPSPPAEGGGNMTDAIERIANSSPAPITKKELKRQLAALGFPADRLAGYFYTPVMRLKEKKRITVLQDGKIWKAPS
jgi:hypothetical protein